MESVYIAAVVVAVVLLVVLMWLYRNQTRCGLDLDSHWHVPEEALEDFGLSAFVFSRDYLYIENEHGQVIFDSPVRCEIIKKSKCYQLEVCGGPDFANILTIEPCEDSAGFYLIDSEDELVAYVERLD